MSSALPTKLGQAPKDSPRTLASNRRRLGSLFSSLSILKPSTSSPSSLPAQIDASQTQTSQTGAYGDRTVETPTKRAGAMRSWLSAPKEADGPEGSEGLESIDLRKSRSPSSCGCVPRLPGGIVHSPNEESHGTSESREKGVYSYILELPDELIVQILLHLPPTIQDLLSLSLVSKRFRAISESPILWSSLIDSTPGYKLDHSIRHRLEAVSQPPGRWDGLRFVPAPKPLDHILNATVTNDSIPIHYPTFYRSQQSLMRLMTDPKSMNIPFHREVLTGHEEPVYCVELCHPWLFTGSRDRSIRVWHVGQVGRCREGEDASTQQPRLVKVVEKAHHGSVLRVRFEMNEKQDGGVLITGSSDTTAGIWSVKLGEKVTVERIDTLSGHDFGVLDVLLNESYIVTCSRDVRVYDRQTLQHRFTLLGHSGPVNALAFDPTNNGHHQHVVSASGDGHWIIWDMTTGEEIRRGGVEGRGIACIAWKDRIITGDSRRQIEAYDPTTGQLRWTVPGHDVLVRSIAIDPVADIIVSGGYDTQIGIRNMKSGETLRRLRDHHTSHVFGVTTARGQIVSVSHDKTVQVSTFGADLPYRDLLV